MMAAGSGSCWTDWAKTFMAQQNIAQQNSDGSNIGFLVVKHTLSVCRRHRDVSAPAFFDGRKAAQAAWKGGPLAGMPALRIAGPTWFVGKAGLGRFTLPARIRS